MTLTLDQFPLLTAAFGNRAKYLEQALVAINDGLAKGSIPNPVYANDVKPVVANAIEAGWRKVQEVYLVRGRGNPDAYPDAVRDLCYYSHPQAHTIPGLLGKIEKLPKSDVVDAAIAYLREIAPLGRAVVTLKDMAVKRQPKPDAEVERKAKYDAPRVAGTAVGIVKDILTKITDDAYGELVKALIKRHNRIIDIYIDLSEKTKDLRFNQKYNDPDYKALRAIEKEDGSDFLYDALDSRTLQRKPGADEVIEKAATRQADQTREHFIYKNLDKIASILDAKGNFKDAKLLDRKVLSGLEGTIRMEFTDGSRFTVKNAVVYVVNSHGTRFNRFPLTFHDVVMPDGSKMKAPSEERMNTVFVGKTA